MPGDSIPSGSSSLWFLSEEEASLIIGDRTQFEIKIMLKEVAECSLSVRALKARARRILCDPAALLQAAYASGQTFEATKKIVMRLALTKIDENPPSWLS